MPRAAVLSIHARAEDTGPFAWDDPALAQVWGPRYQVYVIAAEDIAVFRLSRLPAGGKIRERANDLAARVHALLDGESMRSDDAGQALGTHGNNLRYAALPGTLAIRWEGARRPSCGTWRRRRSPPPRGRSSWRAGTCTNSGRTKRTVTIQAWKRLARAGRYAVVAEAESLPLPDTGQTVVHWD